jgi:AraC family transcriptional regulator
MRLEDYAMDIRIENWPATRIAYVAAKGAYAKVIPESFKTLSAFAMRQGLWDNAAAKTLCVTHDDPHEVDEAELRSEAAITVAPGFASDDPQVQVRTMPGGKYAVASYVGPYSGLGAAWAEVFSQLTPTNGYTLRAGELFEVYMNDCSKVRPHELRTDIHVPVE